MYYFSRSIIILCNRSVLALFAIALVLTGLVGCAMSAGDFIQLSEQQQVEVVCDEKPDVERLANNLSSDRNEIKEINFALSKGYRLREECETKVVGSICTSREEGDKVVTDCDDKREKVCKKVPYSIDPERELARKKILTKRVFMLDIQHKAAHKLCRNEVENLTTEEKYLLYKEYY